VGTNDAEANGTPLCFKHHREIEGARRRQAPAEVAFDVVTPEGRMSPDWRRTTIIVVAVSLALLLIGGLALLLISPG
jgi:hypothetical protein